MNLRDKYLIARISHKTRLAAILPRMDLGAYRARMNIDTVKLRLHIEHGKTGMTTDYRAVRVTCMNVLGKSVRVEEEELGRTFVIVLQDPSFDIMEALEAALLSDYGARSQIDVCQLDVALDFMPTHMGNTRALCEQAISALRRCVAPAALQVKEPADKALPRLVLRTRKEAEALRAAGKRAKTIIGLFTSPRERCGDIVSGFDLDGWWDKSFCAGVKAADGLDYKIYLKQFDNIGTESAEVIPEADQYVRVEVSICGGELHTVLGATSIEGIRAGKLSGVGGLFKFLVPTLAIAHPNESPQVRTLREKLLDVRLSIFDEFGSHGFSVPAGHSKRRTKYGMRSHEAMRKMADTAFRALQKRITKKVGRPRQIIKGGCGTSVLTVV